MEKEQVPQSTETPAAAKKPWQSKTNWMALILALSAFFPSVQALIQANPELYGTIVSGIFMALRMISSDKISIS